MLVLRQVGVQSQWTRVLPQKVAQKEKGKKYHIHKSIRKEKYDFTNTFYFG